MLLFAWAALFKVLSAICGVVTAILALFNIA